MSSSPPPNFESLDLARQVIQLNEEVHRAVKERQYDHAAALRDRREVLQVSLNEFGDPVVVKNLAIALKSLLKASPVLELLERAESTFDAELLMLFNTARLPVRWLLIGGEKACQATLARYLRTESLDSVYFQARLPVFSSVTLAKATFPMEWLSAAIRETARASSPVVWIVQEPAYLPERGVLNVLMQVLRVESTQFVVCLAEADTISAAQFAELSAVSMSYNR